MTGWLGPDWDRGYVKGREQGIVEERERIIRLLEELKPGRPAYEMPMEYWVERKLVEQLIALIREGK
jgi:hypothetical protein